MASIGKFKESLDGLAGSKGDHFQASTTVGKNSLKNRSDMNTTHTTVKANGEQAVPQDRNVPQRNVPQRNSVWFLVVCFLGIFISYFIYGLFQEKITKRKFGDENFRFFLSLVLVQCIVNALFARVVCAVRNYEASLQPHSLFSCLAFTYVGAMVASNSALSYVSYPTQVLGKSAKPIPVLFLNILIGGRRYPRVKFLIVLLIVVGVALFFYKDGEGTGNGATHHKFLDLIGFGELLLLISLTLDGLTGTIQDRLRTAHDVSAHHMMYAVNVYAAVYLSVSVVLSGELWTVSAFIQRHPDVLYNIAIFSISSAIGQNFIFLTVTCFGPLTTSIITTTRKFFTILASVLFFGNALLPRQWVGVVMVFIGLGTDAYFGRATRN